MSVYLDASVLVSLLTDDAFARRADAFVQDASLPLLVSDFAAAEFASVVARGVRMKNISPDKARNLLADFDTFCDHSTASAETSSADVRSAEKILRRLDLPLRAPDALHIAIAQRAGAELATFDEKMAAGARALGLPVAAV